MASRTVEITVRVHARRFYLFLRTVELLVLLGVIDPIAAHWLVERWAMPILAPYAETGHKRFRL